MSGNEQRACGRCGAKNLGYWEDRHGHRAATLRKALSTVSDGQQSMGMRLAFC
jgi:hypothetical protein